MSPAEAHGFPRNGVEGMTDPHVPRVADGRLYGRGAFDMKGSLAACMVAGAAAAGAGLAGDVIVAAVSDEEYASVGCRAVAERFGAGVDAAVVTEPTGLQACVAHKGLAWATIEARGRAAHGSRPDLGADAIVHMGAVLAELGALDDLLARARALEPALDASGAITLVRDPFEVDPGAGVVRAVRAVAAEVVGREIEVVGHTAWMDAAILSAAGVETVVFGPGGAGAHAVEEWVDLGEVALCARTLVGVAADICG